MNNVLLKISEGKRLNRVLTKEIQKIQGLESTLQLLVLSVLSDCIEPPTQNDIAYKVGMDKSNITHLIDTLEVGKLATRHKDKKDRRTFRIHITELGKQVLKSCKDTLEVLK